MISQVRMFHDFSCISISRSDKIEKSDTMIVRISYMFYQVMRRSLSAETLFQICVSPLRHDDDDKKNDEGEDDLEKFLLVRYWFSWYT